MKMYCLFLIFLVGFYPKFRIDALEISVGNGPSSAFEAGLESSESHHYGGGLHWDGISGILIRQLFRQNSPSYSSSNNGYQYQAPIYGNTGYTTGQVNAIRTVYTGQSSDNYNGYASNYWTCVNNYRGQYYYSYTYGHYVCDTRANQYGK